MCECTALWICVRSCRACSEEQKELGESSPTNYVPQKQEMFFCKACLFIFMQIMELVNNAHVCRGLSASTGGAGEPRERFVYPELSCPTWGSCSPRPRPRSRSGLAGDLASLRAQRHVQPQRHPPQRPSLKDTLHATARCCASVDSARQSGGILALLQKQGPCLITNVSEQMTSQCTGSRLWFFPTNSRLLPEVLVPSLSWVFLLGGVWA